MRALVARPGTFAELEERPAPRPETGDIVIRVKAVGICGTDRKMASGDSRVPSGGIVLGHEFTGVIADVGPRADVPVRVGARVGVAPVVWCATCSMCRIGRDEFCERPSILGINVDGAMAEYVAIPSRAVTQGNIVEIPDSVSFIDAALAEPIACCLRSHEQLDVQPGMTAVVIGAGPLGAIHVALLHRAGARVISVDKHPARLRLARQLGAQSAVDPEEAVSVAKEFTSGRGADVVIIAASSTGALELGRLMVANGGRVCLFAGVKDGHGAQSFGPNEIHYRQLSVVGRTGATVQAYQRSMGILRDRVIATSSIVTTIKPFGHVVESLRASDTRDLKVVLLMGGNARSVEERA